MSLYFDNEKLFDAGGHLTDIGLNALQAGTLDELGSLEAAEHLTFCDYCLMRYTALVEAMPEKLQAPMRDLIPQVQNLMRLRSFRIMTNRYVSAAAAVMLAFALWRFGVSAAPAVEARPERELTWTAGFSEMLDGLHDAVYGGIADWTTMAQSNLSQLTDKNNGGPAAEGE